MTYILAIESATKNCSVALLNDKQILACKEEVNENFSHAEQLHLFIADTIEQAGITFDHLDAIAISKGPGSFTGLRIGSATAKGLCYALNIPLIAVSTLQAMALAVTQTMQADLFCPMIDARRMEVYSALYNQAYQQIKQVKAEIINESSYQEELKGSILFFGDGAKKCQSLIHHPNAQFLDEIYPSAKEVGILAFEKWEQNIFEDVAYFEPYYLKEFVSGKSVKE